MELANRDTRGFCKEIRLTKATKSKLPHFVDEIDGECKFAEMWQHQFRHRFNCMKNSKSNFHVNVGSVEFEPFFRRGDLFTERKPWQKKVSRRR